MLSDHIGPHAGDSGRDAVDVPRVGTVRTWSMWKKGPCDTRGRPGLDTKTQERINSLKVVRHARARFSVKRERLG